MPANLSFDFQPATGRARDTSAPFRLLLIGDFSGRPADQKAPLARRPVMRVDVDNFDAVLQRIAPVQRDIAFATLDDFHPDALFDRMPVFAALRQTRRRLLDPASFAQAAAELGAAPLATSSGGSDLLAGLLGGKPAANPPAASGIDALIRQVVAPHVVPDIQPQQSALLAAVDAAVAEQMRQLLHDSGFQALEANWRGVQWLVSRLELDETLQLQLFDASRDELLADLVAAQGQPLRSGLHQALVENTGAREPGWDLCAALYSFGPAATDIGLLAALGLLAAQAGGPVLAAGDTALALAEAPALAGWQALRRSQAAPWLGLTAPRLLLRLPYGKRSDPASHFAFEEFSGSPGHEQLLWGSGALAAALLICRGGSAVQIDDLPAYSFERDGEMQLQPCAEQLLSEQAGQALLGAGLMPLLSHRNRNAVTLMRLVSIADPPQALAGLPEAR
jgi:type VI secretion system protein ImpC